MPAKTLERTESVASVDLSWEGLRQPMPLVIEQHFHGHQLAPNYDYAHPAKYVGPQSEKATEMESSISSRETIDLVLSTVETARQSIQQSLSGSERVGETVQLKLTIDLGHNRIGDLPDEVIDVFRRDVERLVLSHNQISRIPFKFAECASLTYLNLRANRLTEFPRAVYLLLDLQILDLSRNSLRKIPEEIRNMRALRVFSVSNNKIEDIPFAVGFLDSLQIIRLSNNPLNEGLKGILNSNDVSTSDLPTPIAENEKESWLTRKIKNFLKSEATSLESGGESSESPLDTPRPLKRNVSLRFPIVPTTSGSEASPDLRSPALGKPLISQRHYRVASGQTFAPPNAGLRRPGLTPLTIGNERIRSNSESILQASQNTRNKRMGMVSRKNSELGKLSEVQAQRNSAHFRGFSYGSVLRDSRDDKIANTLEGLRSTEVVDTAQESTTFVRRLSSLPEHKSESFTSNPFLESAKGILYSLHQMHPHVSTLLVVLRIKSATTSNLESAYSQASKNLSLLDWSLHQFEQSTNNNALGENMTYQIGYRCRVCLVTYQDVGKLLLDNTSHLTINSDQRYLRTWLLFIFGNLVEARNACLNLGLVIKNEEKIASQAANSPTTEYRYKITAHGETAVPSLTPTKERPYPTRRVRNENSSKQNRTHGHVLSNTRHAVPLHNNNRSRSNSRTNASSISTASSIINTPRSGETFFVPGTPLVAARSDGKVPSEDVGAESDILFERIYHDFNQSIELGLQVVPRVCRQFRHSLEIARSRYASNDIKDVWKRLIGHCQNYLNECETLKRSMANVRLNDPGSNFDKFWVSCGEYTRLFIKLIDEVKDANSNKLMGIGPDISRTLHPVYKSVKVTALNVQNSPWAWVFNRDSPPKRPDPARRSRAAEDEHYNGSSKSINVSHKHSQTGSGSSSSQYGSSVPMTPVPATPLSAALGPAAQATVPNTPSSNTTINFFERLEAYKNSMQNSQYNRH